MIRRIKKGQCKKDILEKLLSDGDLITLRYESNIYENIIFRSVDACKKGCSTCEGYCIRHSDRPKGSGYCLYDSLLHIDIIKQQARINKITEI